MRTQFCSQATIHSDAQMPGKVGFKACGKELAVIVITEISSTVAIKYPHIISERYFSNLYLAKYTGSHLVTDPSGIAKRCILVRIVERFKEISGDIILSAKEWPE